MPFFFGLLPTTAVLMLFLCDGEEIFWAVSY